mmetsp:Transcript_24081/g.54764  ORF Transcript_24081/g.54764 Transcript_24081/m.54764 type:complete len:155 (-) Transcript_24081:383-847(-)
MTLRAHHSAISVEKASTWLTLHPGAGQLGRLVQVCGMRILGNEMMESEQLLPPTQLTLPFSEFTFSAFVGSDSAHCPYVGNICCLRLAVRQEHDAKLATSNDFLNNGLVPILILIEQRYHHVANFDSCLRSIQHTLELQILYHLTDRHIVAIIV